MSIFVKIIFNRTATSRNEDSSTQASWLSIPIVYSCQNPNDVTEIHEIVLLMEDPLNDPDLSLPITRMILVSRLHTKKRTNDLHNPELLLAFSIVKTS